MENASQAKHNQDEQIHRKEFTNLAPVVEFFVKYQLPWINVDKTSNSSDNDTHFNIFQRDPLAELLSSKRRFLYKSLEEIVELIEEREQFKDSALYQIDKDICEVRTKMLNLPHEKYVLIPEINKVYNLFQQQVFALYKEKRAEEVSCWRDVIRLKSDLRESDKELEQEKRKQSLLSGGMSGRRL